MAVDGIIPRKIVKDAAIGPLELGGDVAGNGITGGAGSALAVEQATGDDGAAVTVAVGGLSINGDLVSVDETFSNITPNTGGTGVDVKDLASILKGIDDALGSVGGATPTLSGLTVSTDGQTVFNLGQATSGPYVLNIRGVDYYSEHGDFTISTTTLTNDTLTWNEQLPVGSLLKSDPLILKHYV